MEKGGEMETGYLDIIVNTPELLIDDSVLVYNQRLENMHGLLCFRGLFHWGMAFGSAGC